ncbi:MAG TPA: 3-phosphoshikimate 1-carboxyvinyltransferase, partial [Opitutales bacterium]|nr:3-phosphoshikimate 1-carboxyvinyltransferase [Opitutales bacterium]
MPETLPEVLPIRPFTRPAGASVRVPGSKSITNRALAFGAICGAGVEIVGALESRDTRIMQAALAALGRSVRANNGGVVLEKASGSDIFPVHAPLVKLHVGNAGTAARFLTALLCLQDGGVFHVDGDEAMYKRPMKGLTDALATLGAEFEFHGEEGCIPFTLKTHWIRGDRVSVDASQSSQILSALLIMAAGVGRPFAVELTGKTVSEPFVAMTVEMLRQFGATVRVEKNGRHLVTGPVRFSFGNTYVVEPDATAASYFLALPIAAGGEATLENFGEIRLQGDIRFANVLRSAGLSVKGRLDLPDHPNEMRTALDGAAKGVTADFEAFSDTFLTLAALSPLLAGKTRIDGIAHTRKQETDRVAAMATELKKLGQKVTEEDGSLEIEPDPEALVALARKARTQSPGGCIEIDTYRDHRFAMSFAILGCRDLLGDGRPWLAIKDPSCCGKTF